MCANCHHLKTETQLQLLFTQTHEIAYRFSTNIDDSNMQHWWLQNMSTRLCHIFIMTETVEWYWYLKGIAEHSCGDNWNSTMDETLITLTLEIMYYNTSLIDVCESACTAIPSSRTSTCDFEIWQNNPKDSCMHKNIANHTTHSIFDDKNTNREMGESGNISDKHLVCSVPSDKFAPKRYTYACLYVCVYTKVNSNINFFISAFQWLNAIDIC